MIIAIDGPAASGKSSAARAVAERLGLTFLDTGAMYRAVTLCVLEAGASPADGETCGRIADGLDLGFDPQGRVLLDGRCGEPAIRSSEVTAAVSAVAAHPSVRSALVRIQRRIGEQGGLVAEGRDTTTVVFPDAEHKFFLVASPRVRARRRALELGVPEQQAQLEAAIAERDRLDSGRAVSPLREAQDATRIETDDLSAAEVVECILTYIKGSAN